MTRYLPQAILVLSCGLVLLFMAFRLWNTKELVIHDRATYRTVSALVALMGVIATLCALWLFFHLR